MEFPDEEQTPLHAETGEMGLLITTFFFYLSLVSMPSAAFSHQSNDEMADGRRPNSRAVIDVQGGPESVVWVIQLSDLHFSVFHPERALDFRTLVGPALAMINPSLVFITGDLTDGKSKDLLTMKQNEKEWVEYDSVIKDVISRSGLDKKIFYDLRGNHDNFGVPVGGGTFDFFQKYSITAGSRRTGNVHSVTLQASGSLHACLTMGVGLRGPTNVFGHPTDQLLHDLEAELSQWDSQSKEPVTKISFGHFPLSFSAGSDSGKTLEDVFFKHSLSSYLCGHLHTKFGKNLKRHHVMRHQFLSLEKYLQLNVYQGTLGSNAHVSDCPNKTSLVKEFWEWEMGDWRTGRIMRILGIDSGYISFVDFDSRLGAKKPIILPTFPLDSRFMQRISSHNEYNCMTTSPSYYATVRALVFSKQEIASVVVRIYDSMPGTLNLVLETSMRKHEGNDTRGDLYSAPWNWRAFEDPSPDRFWLEVEATDISGRSSVSQLRPFSINGLAAKISWSWREFLVMGCQWSALYYPILWTNLAFLFSLLLLPKAFLMVSVNPYTYKNVSDDFRMGKVGKCLLTGICWALVEISKITLLWSGMLIYVLYLMFFPWFFGQVFTESGRMGYMTYDGWTVKIPRTDENQSHLGVPDVMVIVIPHLYLVVLPAFLVSAGLAAEKAAYRVHFLSLSGKKEDDYGRQSDLLCSYAFADSLKYRHCRALTKAYEMNPFLHSAAYCLPVSDTMCCLRKNIWIRQSALLLADLEGWELDLPKARKSGMYTQPILSFIFMQYGTTRISPHPTPRAKSNYQFQQKASNIAMLCFVTVHFMFALLHQLFRDSIKQCSRVLSWNQSPEEGDLSLSIRIIDWEYGKHRLLIGKKISIPFEALQTQTQTQGPEWLRKPSMANPLLRSLRTSSFSSLLRRFSSPTRPFRSNLHCCSLVFIPSQSSNSLSPWRSSWVFRHFCHGAVDLVISEGKPKFETRKVEPSKRARWKSKKQLKMQRKREKMKRKLANKRDPRRLTVKGKKKQKFPNAEARIKHKIENAKIKEALLIERLKRYQVPKLQGPTAEPQKLTGEERFYLKKMGQKQSNYAPVGRRGVFGGVILNMHLHWKKHETVKVICKPCKPGQVHEYATEIARLSGGTPIEIIGNDTIIFYRGKNYVQPDVMSPIDTLSKKRALEKSKYEQSLESVRRFIAISEKELEIYYRHVALYGDPTSRDSNSCYVDQRKNSSRIGRAKLIEEGNDDSICNGFSTDASEMTTDLEDEDFISTEVDSASEDISEAEIDGEIETEVNSSREGMSDNEIESASEDIRSRN
ncbi:hypothetical protein ACLOJK_011835 [Asimina triloba]